MAKLESKDSGDWEISDSSRFIAQSLFNTIKEDENKFDNALVGVFITKLEVEALLKGLPAYSSKVSAAVHLEDYILIPKSVIAPILLWVIVIVVALVMYWFSFYNL